MRRMLSKHPIVEAARLILHHYQEGRYVGTLLDDEGLCHLTPAPTPGRPHRAAWKPSVAPLGPVGLLLYSCHQMGLALSTDFQILCKNENPVPLFHNPIQFLIPALWHFVNLARIHDIRQQRGNFYAVGEIDLRSLRAAISKVDDPDDERQLR